MITLFVAAIPLVISVQTAFDGTLVLILSPLVLSIPKTSSAGFAAENRIAP
jgi:hypothetical protein